MNVYSMEPRKGAVPSAVTSFESHPVRFLSGAGDGTLAFTYDGEIYTMRPGSQPSKVDISLSADFYQPVKRIPVSSAQGGVPSPDGKQIAFTYKGEIFTVPVAGGEARRLTSQPSYETSPVWSPDSKTIAFASDRNGNFDVYTMAADGKSAQWNRLTFNSAGEVPQAFSLDGKNVYYSASIQDRR